MIFDVSIFLTLDPPSNRGISAKAQVTLLAYDGQTLIAQKTYSVEQELTTEGNGVDCKLEVKVGDQMVLSYVGDTSEESLELLSQEEQENFHFFMAQLAGTSESDDGCYRYRFDESALLPEELRLFSRLCRGNLNA